MIFSLPIKYNVPSAYKPINYIKADSKLDGHLKGIDDKLGHVNLPIEQVILANGTYNITPYTSTLITNEAGITSDAGVILKLPNLNSGTLDSPNVELNGKVTSILNDNNTYSVTVVSYQALQLVNGNNIPVIIPPFYGADIYTAGIYPDCWVVRIYPVFIPARNSVASLLPYAYDATPETTPGKLSALFVAAGVMLPLDPDLP